MSTFNTTREGQDVIKREKPQDMAVKVDERFDNEPQKDSSDKGEQRDLLAETLDKWEMLD